MLENVSEWLRRNEVWQRQTRRLRPALFSGGRRQTNIPNNGLCYGWLSVILLVPKYIHTVGEKAYIHSEVQPICQSEIPLPRVSVARGDRWQLTCQSKRKQRSIDLSFTLMHASEDPLSDSPTSRYLYNTAQWLVRCQMRRKMRQLTLFSL